MDKEILSFGDIEIAKNKFYHHKTAIFWEMMILRQYLTRFSLVKKTYPQVFLKECKCEENVIRYINHTLSDFSSSSSSSSKESDEE